VYRYAEVISYADLQTMEASAGIEMTQKESYLSDGEFKQVMGMTMEGLWTS
jgi:hypothetical protein